MNIKKIIVGKLEENCYILEKNDNVLIIDPGDESDKIVNEIDNKNVLAILITHYHFDHVGALNNLINKYNVPIIDINSNSNQIIDNFDFEIIKTPGHKQDAVTYYFKEDKIMFVGDFVFKGTIGRCDLPGGNFEEMKKSVTMLKKYDGNIILYPGHGDKTTIGEEMNYNTYFRGE